MIDQQAHETLCVLDLGPVAALPEHVQPGPRNSIQQVEGILKRDHQILPPVYDTGFMH